MSNFFSVRAARMMTLACIPAFMAVAVLPARADDASAQGFIQAESSRAAPAKAAPTRQAKPGRQARAEPVVPAARAGSKGQRPAANPLASAPEHLRALVRREAAANGVPVTLAKAVVTIESRWNPRVTGSAGEVGLMQIKHPTARMIGYTGTRAGLYDPATNIRWGMKYLAGAHRLAGGDLCGTVSRYQGGHGVRGVTRMGSVYCAKARGYIAAMPAAASPRLALGERNAPRG